MNEKKDKDFLETVVSYGLVLRTGLGTLEKIKEFVAETDAKVVYQKTSAGKLEVVEKDKGGVE